MQADKAVNQLSSSEVDALFGLSGGGAQPVRSSHRLTYRLSISENSVNFSTLQFGLSYSASENPKRKHFVLPDNLEIVWRGYMGLYVWLPTAGGLQRRSHSKVLGLDDLPAIISSGADFARKFAPDFPVLDEIDKMLS